MSYDLPRAQVAHFRAVTGCDVVRTPQRKTRRA